LHDRLGCDALEDALVQRREQLGGPVKQVAERRGRNGHAFARETPSKAVMRHRVAASAHDGLGDEAGSILALVKDSQRPWRGHDARAALAANAMLHVPSTHHLARHVFELERDPLWHRVERLGAAEIALWQVRRWRVLDGLFGQLALPLSGGGTLVAQGLGAEAGQLSTAAQFSAR